MALEIFPPTTPFLSFQRWRAASPLTLPALHKVLFNKTTQLLPQHPHGPDPGLRPVRHQALRTRERASRTRFPADTHASVLDSPIALLEYDQDPISGSAAQLGPCPTPHPPASRRDRRDRTARARGVSRVNRLGAAGVWSSGDGTHRNVHSQ